MNKKSSLIGKWVVVNDGNTFGLNSMELKLGQIIEIDIGSLSALIQINGLIEETFSLSTLFTIKDYGKLVNIISQHLDYPVEDFKRLLEVADIYRKGNVKEALFLAQSSSEIFNICLDNCKILFLREKQNRKIRLK